MWDFIAYMRTQQVILLRFKFQGVFSRDSLKKLDIEKKDVKTEQWARTLDLIFLTSLPSLPSGSNCVCCEFDVTTPYTHLCLS